MFYCKRRCPQGRAVDVVREMLRNSDAACLSQAISSAIHSPAQTSSSGQSPAILPMHSRSFGAPAKQALAMAERNLGLNYIGLGVATDAAYVIR